jgi:hypothetical protein
MADSRSRVGNVQYDLEHAVLADSKETIKDDWGMAKMTQEPT